MTRSPRIPALLAALTVGLPIVGCGDTDEGDPIPPAKVERLNTEFDVAQQHVADGLCDEATTAVAQARATVDTLDDDGVGSDVQDALGDGVDNLSDLVRQDCQGEDDEETTVPEETTPTETIPPETTPTETTPTETTPTETTEPTPVEPEPLPGEEEEPDEGDGGAQFIPPGKAKKEGED